MAGFPPFLRSRPWWLLLGLFVVEFLLFDQLGARRHTPVYPREVVREALLLNAGAIIVCHNHPSGQPEPSRADEYLTQSLKSALAIVDVRLIDHIVVAGGQSVSLAQRGLL